MQRAGVMATCQDLPRSSHRPASLAGTPQGSSGAAISKGSLVLLTPAPLSLKHHTRGWSQGQVSCRSGRRTEPSSPGLCSPQLALTKFWGFQLCAVCPPGACWTAQGLERPFPLLAVISPRACPSFVHWRSWHRFHVCSGPPGSIERWWRSEDLSLGDSGVQATLAGPRWGCSLTPRPPLGSPWGPSLSFLPRETLLVLHRCDFCPLALNCLLGWVFHILQGHPATSSMKLPRLPLRHFPSIGRHGHSSSGKCGDRAGAGAGSPQPTSRPHPILPASSKATGFQ